jgi:branched-subunit amino acid aminotransferase/4-amino-4-deoxychorismate lyase
MEKNMSRPDNRPEKVLTDSAQTKIEIVNTVQDWVSRLSKHPAQQNYLAMYSSWSNAIVTNPSLMMIPLDDHMVHRGDGVFEAIKMVGGKIYLLDAHLARLRKSMEMISLAAPMPEAELKELVVHVARAAKEPDLLLRLYVSRGPGGFGVDPKESVGSQFYAVASRLKNLDEAIYNSGVKAITVDNHLKEGIWSTVKSCNYLPNVMMKMAANSKGAFLSINKTKDNFLGEGSTENILVLTEDHRVLYPPFDYTLRGTTLLRLIELMKSAKYNIEQKQISMTELYSAKQVMAIGTTLEAISIVEIDGKKIADGKVSEFSQWARSLLAKDVKSDSYATTKV